MSVKTADFESAALPSYAKLASESGDSRAAHWGVVFARFERTAQDGAVAAGTVDAEDFLDPDELAEAPAPAVDPDLLQYKEACDGCGVHLSWIDPCTICSHECTWCLECTDANGGVCPNCSGELSRRPKRTQPVKR